MSDELDDDAPETITDPLAAEELATAISNGWTLEALNAYRTQRASAHNLVPGNVITEFKRGKPAKYLMSGRTFNPFKWK